MIRWLVDGYLTLCVCERGDLYNSMHKHNQQWYMHLQTAKLSLIRQEINLRATLCKLWKSIISVKGETGWTGVRLTNMWLDYSQGNAAAYFQPSQTSSRENWKKISQGPLQSLAAAIIFALSRSGVTHLLLNDMNSKCGTCRGSSPRWTKLWIKSKKTWQKVVSFLPYFLRQLLLNAPI